MLKQLFTLAIIVTLTACSSDDDKNEEPQPRQFTATQTFEVTLSGQQQVPSVTTTSEASATIEYDEILKQIRATLDTEGVTGVTGAHIHQGGIGLNGDVAFAFEAANTNSFEIAATTLSDSQIDELMMGQWYINVHTESNPDGEVRGQIVGSDTTIMTFSLDGEQEVPAVETDSMGYGYAMYNSTSMELVVRAVTTGLDDATAAHIHTGAIGTNGDVLVGLVQNTASMDTWETPDNTVIDSETLSTLLSGGHYVNIHTSSVASGELRGQILADHYALVTFELSGGQEVPMVKTDGSGNGYALVNTDDYSLWLTVVTENLDDVSGVHIHTGEFGSNGDVLVALEQSMDHDNTWMTPTNTMIDAETFGVLAEGGHYVNVHTEKVASGEIRGQILMDQYALSTFALSGKQEVPMVDTSAMGSGYALVNKDTMTLSVKVVTSGLDDASAAHIHTGRVGMNGDVLVALAQAESDTTMWMTAEPVAVDMATYEVLASGGHYVNVHSASNPSGELRGQILMANHKLMTFKLDGEQEVPAITTDAMGDGYALVDSDTMMMELVVVTSGVSDANMAHIHAGRVGENGGVVVALEQSQDDMNVWMAPAQTMLEADVYSTLMTGGLYVNIHSPEEAAGEIRGQIISDHYSVVTFDLSGAQENPPVVTSAYGDGYALVNHNSMSFELTVVSNGVSDATAAHIHSGYRGENGDVVVALEQAMDNDNIWMTGSEIMLDAATFATFVDGGHYVNIHTPLFPSGEIRGQIE